MRIVFINRIYAIRNIFRSIQYFSGYFSIIIGAVALLLSLSRLFGFDFGISYQHQINIFKLSMAIDIVVFIIALVVVVCMDKIIKDYRESKK